MPAIGIIGTEVRVTPGDRVWIAFSPENHEFINDRCPFSLRVAGIREEAGQILGVYGQVISGHERYRFDSQPYDPDPPPEHIKKTAYVGPYTAIV